MSVKRTSQKRAPVTPGEILLEEFLKPLNITQAAFAQAIGVSSAYVSDIVNGRRGISVEMALRFEAAIEMPADFWIRAQAATDLYRAQHNKAIIEQQRKVKKIYVHRAA